MVEFTKSKIVKSFDNYPLKHVTDKKIHAVREEVFEEYCVRDDSV